MVKLKQISKEAIPAAKGGLPMLRLWRWLLMTREAFDDFLSVRKESRKGGE